MSLRVEWKFEPDSADVLAVMNTLEPIVVATFADLPVSLSHAGYYVSDDNRRVSNIEKSKLDDAIARLPDSLKSISSDYESPSGSQPRFVASIWVSGLRHSGTASVNVDLKGPDSNETSGWVEHVRRRVQKEVDRLNEHGWNSAAVSATPQTAPMNISSSSLLHVGQAGSPQPAPVPTTQTPSPNKEPHWLTKESIIGVIALLVVVLGAWLVKNLVENNDSGSQPATTSSTEPTPTATAVSPPTPTPITVTSTMTLPPSAPSGEASSTVVTRVVIPVVSCEPTAIYPQRCHTTFATAP